MKFHVAWDSIEKENRNLKILAIALLILSLGLTVSVMNVAAQPPLIVERSCLTKILDPATENPTDEEMKVFVAEALKARFNADVSDDDLLSVKQVGFRIREQEELRKQKMKQVVVVNSVVISKEGASVDADRVISVGEIRSTLKFPLTVKFEKVSRARGNPYGLVLTEVIQAQEGVKK